MVPIPLTFRLLRPSTESSYGQKLTNSWRQKLNAADAPVSRTRSLKRYFVIKSPALKTT